MRKYKMTRDGEKPVWMSDTKLRSLGTSDAGADARSGKPRARWGNVVMDRAYDAEWKRITGKDVKR